MESFLPFFPLNLVVFPNEKLNLHIFEPRYRQLINETIENESTFGIPAFINNKLPGFGTEVKIIELTKRYEDGRLDLKTEGVQVFKMISFENPVRNKMFAGGKVRLIENGNSFHKADDELITLLQKLQTLLESPFDFDSFLPFFSFQIAHKIGLSLEDEYKLLLIEDEEDRQLFILKHLRNIVPVLTELDRTKTRIRMNGHFKNLDPLEF